MSEIRFLGVQRTKLVFCFLFYWLVLEPAGVPVTAVKGAHIMCLTPYVHSSFKKLIRKYIHDNLKFILDPRTRQSLEAHFAYPHWPAIQNYYTFVLVHTDFSLAFLKHGF